MRRLAVALGARRGLADRFAGPKNVLRGGAVALGVVMSVLGALGLGVLGEPCLAGEVVGAGQIERSTASGEPPLSSLSLRGSPTVFLFGTDITAAYGTGEFVVVCGSTEGQGVRAHSIRLAQDPASAGLPYLWGASGIFLVLALDLAIPRLMAPIGAKEANAEGGGLPSGMRLRRVRSAPLSGRGDNHSGAAAGKD